MAQVHELLETIKSPELTRVQHRVEARTMATFTESSAEANEQNKIKVLREMKDVLEHIGEKQSTMERRQCDEVCVGTDAIRMCESFVRGEHANLTEHAVESVCKMIFLNKSAKATTYGELFREKDMRRAEYLV